MSFRSSRKPTSMSRAGRGRAAAARYSNASTSPDAERLYSESFRALEGNGVPQDAERSFALNAEAAAFGHHDAVLAMGWYYLNGIGVEKDLEAARRWYRASARFGEPKAMFSLGTMAIEAGDFDEAREWLRRASDAGHVRSRFYLAKLAWRGEGMPRDRDEAMRLIRAAAAAKVPEARRFLSLKTRLDRPYRRGPKR